MIIITALKANTISTSNAVGNTSTIINYTLTIDQVIPISTQTAGIAITALLTMRDGITVKTSTIAGVISWFTIPTIICRGAGIAVGDITI